MLFSKQFWRLAYFLYSRKIILTAYKSRKSPYFSLERISGKILYSFLESQKLFISSRFIVFQKMKGELNQMEFTPYKITETLEYMFYQVPMKLFFNVNYKNNSSLELKCYMDF